MIDDEFALALWVCAVWFVGAVAFVWRAFHVPAAPHPEKKEK